jgi:hypothetical protein
MLLAPWWFAARGSFFGIPQNGPGRGSHPDPFVSRYGVPQRNGPPYRYSQQETNRDETNLVRDISYTVSQPISEVSNA